MTKQYRSTFKFDERYEIGEGIESGVMVKLPGSKAMTAVNMGTVRSIKNGRATVEHRNPGDSLSTWNATTYEIGQLRRVVDVR